MTIWTKSFLIALLERAIATFLMTFIAISGLDAGGFIGVQSLNINWVNALVGAGIAAALSILKGVIANLDTKDGHSLSHSEKVDPTLPAPAQT